MTNPHHAPESTGVGRVAPQSQNEGVGQGPNLTQNLT
jgi:hypothetical protein